MHRKYYLHNHSILLTALLEQPPEEAVARIYNDSGTELTPSVAIFNLKEQQNRANMLFRNLEQLKLNQLLKSANIATNISSIHELPAKLGDQDEVKENILKSLYDFTAEGSPDSIEDSLDIFLE